MNRTVLEERTRKFHIEIIKLCEHMLRNAAGFETAKQLIRSAGSVAANYRASKRSKSKADFVYKIQVVLEEADESLYWLEIIRDASLLTGEVLSNLINEANELTAIFAATLKTIKLKDPVSLEKNISDI